MFHIEITASAERDLRRAAFFYRRQAPGLGVYFFDSLTADIDSLRLFAGVHPKPLCQFHRALSKRFPFAIYYDFDGRAAYVVAVFDCRRKPETIQAALSDRRPSQAPRENQLTPHRQV